MINLSLIGAGRIGAIHGRTLVSFADVNIKYVVDVSNEAASSLADELGAAVTDVETAITDSAIDGVIIASSTDTHADLIEQAALAGKAIFCEKPVDLSLNRVKQCINTVKESKVSCTIGFNRRYDPSFSELKSCIDSGDIGQLESIQIISRDPTPPPVEYIAVSGGLFKDMTIHDFDMARWLLGEEPTEVFATGSCLVDSKIEKANDIDSATVVLKTASGKMCQITNSRRAVYGYDQRIEAFGSKGMLQVNNVTESSVIKTGEVGGVHPKPQYFFLERYEQAYKIELTEFVNTIKTGSIPKTSEVDGLKALLLAEAAQESLLTKKVVMVNLEEGY